MWRVDEAVEFRYDAAYAHAKGPAVAFTLPVNDMVVRTDRLRVPPFFAGLLPEGDSRRGHIQRAFHLAEDDELGLLSVVGADTVGDTQVVPTGQALPVDPEPTMAWDEVSFAELWSKLPGPRTQSSLPGIQPKMSAHSRSVHGGAVGPVILKFAIAGWHGVLQNERLFMSAARGVGLLAAPVEIVTDKDGAEALAVERFDRTETADGSTIRHAQEDATQILGLRPGQKYDPDARTVIDALASRCAAPKVAVRDLFHQLVYSYMIGNNDLHAKNLSIRQDPVSGLWSVSPIYDVLHTWPYEGDHRFSPAVRPEGPRDAVSRKWWLELATDLGLPAKAAQVVIRQVTHAAETMISRALTNDGLPTALHRDVRRVIARRARDLTGAAG
jgi:serine/threonine-protein kinase HipA